MLSIGEFSRATGLSVKTLRFYHEQGVLAPSRVDASSGYRYYAEDKIETARVITHLRQLEFPLKDIAEILENYDEESDILDYLERQRAEVQTKLSRYSEIGGLLDQMITQQKESRDAMQNASYDVTEKTIEPMLIAGLRMRGRYSDCGKGFGKIGRKFGFKICGKPFMLIYDSEYKEDDADFEVCMPVRKGNSVDDITVRELPGGRCVSLIYKGPYDGISRAYEQLFKHVKANGDEVVLPSREVYLKGPGMIFKGNPKKYLTEVQLMLR